MVDIVTDQATINIDRVVVLPYRRRQIVHALKGILWITQEGDARDIVLYAGESTAFTGRGRIMVQPLQASATFTAESRQGRLGRLGTLLSNLARRLQITSHQTNATIRGSFAS